MNSMIEPLPTLLIEPLVRAALAEDMGRAGDITSRAIFPADARCTGAIVAREPGTLAGTDAATLAFRLLDPTVGVKLHRPDGSTVEAGDVVMRIDGPARSVLGAERVALNLLCHLSGIATATAELVQAAKPHRARITCTRKTTPNLRALEKQAVRAGGGVNHRFGLDDAVLIKDNHIAVAGGVRAAFEAARANAGHLVKIEVEVDDLAMLAELLELRVDAVLLDNMTPDRLRRAVAMVDGRMLTESSGRVSAETVVPVAEAGVDLISIGALTHSVTVLDIGLDHVDG